MSRPINDSEIDFAARMAQDAFWSTIAKRFPDVRSGDLDPISNLDFRHAAKKVVTVWLDQNGATVQGPPPCAHIDCRIFWRDNTAGGGRPWCLHCSVCDLTMDDCECGRDHDELAQVLREQFPGQGIEVWHTGGGCQNPALILKRVGDEAGAEVYVQFSMGWHPNEASFSLINEKEEGENWAGEVATWSPASPHDVPLSAREIGDLVRRKLTEWLAPLES